MAKQRLNHMYAGIAAGFVAGGLMFCAAATDSERPPTPTEAAADLDSAQTGFANAGAEAAKVQSALGEKCVTLIRLYQPNGPLSTDRDKAVADLVGHPDRPCGASPTEVRLGVITLRGVDQALLTAESALARAQEGVADAEEPQSLMDGFTSMLTLGAIGGAIGAVLPAPKDAAQSTSV